MVLPLKSVVLVQPERGRERTSLGFRLFSVGLAAPHSIWTQHSFDSRASAAVSSSMCCSAGIAAAILRRWPLPRTARVGAMDSVLAAALPGEAECQDS